MKPLRTLIPIFIIFLTVNYCSNIKYYIPTYNKHTSTGLEIFMKRYAWKYKGKKVIVVTNHSGVDFNLNPNINLFKEKGMDVITIMAPEHGLYGFQNEYDKNIYNIDKNYNSIVYNLHKLNRHSLGYLLDKCDAVIFDIQDMGMRCYTYISNLKFVMDTMKGSRKKLIVLDRPNPIGFLGIDGAYLEKKYKSKFISAFPATLIYNMTIGEAALYYKKEYIKNINLKVIPMDGYSKNMYFPETGLPWIPPSPNLPTYESSLIYTVVVLMEGMDISLGRGTAKPFEYIGAPWINPTLFCKGLEKLNFKNFRFRPIYFEPTFSRYSGEKCGGVQIFYTGGKFSPEETAYKIIKYIRKNYKNGVWTKYKNKYNIDYLAGTDKLRKSIDSGKNYKEYKQLTLQKVKKFKKKQKKYLLYY